MSTIVVAIVCQNGQVLMARRRAKEGDLHWQFPGGAVEEGETEFHAAEREISEETGVVCRATTKLGERTHPSSNRHIVYVACDYVSGTAEVKDAEELDRVQWMTPKEVFASITSDLFAPVKKFLEDF